MRQALLLLLLGALAYAQICATYVGTQVGAGIYYVEWSKPTVLYANGSVAAYLPGAGRGILWASGNASSSSPLNLTACFDLQLLAARLKPGETPWGPAAPMGLAYYGLGYYGGVLLPLPYVGDAVMGCFKLENFSALSYSPLGPAEAYSIQLNAYVEASGLYWVQALIRYRDGGFEFLDNVWNMTGPTSVLRGIEGRGLVTTLGRDQYYYYLREMPPTSSGCLEIQVVQNAVRFLVDGELLDEVRLPSPGRIVVAPQVNARGLPIDLELVVGGYGADMPTAKAVNGSAELQLYIWNGTAFTPPPALWSMGLSTSEAVTASVNASNYSAIVEPGYPEARQLYIRPPCIFFLNETAECGGVMYLVTLDLPNGTTYLWARPGRYLIQLPRIDLGTVIYEPAVASIYVDVRGPLHIAPSYEALYLISARTPAGYLTLWAARGQRIYPSNLSFTIGGVRYVAQRLVINGNLSEGFTAEGPANISALYTAIYRGVARDILGLPDPLSVAVLRCGDKTAAALAGPLGVYDVSISDVETLCSASLYPSPLSPYLLAAAILILPKLFRRRNIYKDHSK